MVVVKISGGLGNQMFQYAFALAHASKNKEVKLDTYNYTLFQQHQGFELERLFDISLPTATFRDFFYFMKRNRTSRDEEKYQLKENRYYINEKKNKIQLQYIPDLLSMDDTYFDGFWQNPDYFESISEIVKSCYCFDKIQEQENVILQNKIRSCSSVCIHVRRGDYLTSPFNVLPREYYQKGIEIIEERIDAPVFFIFSDDIEWTKNNIDAKNKVFVNGNEGSRAYRDMQLMSLCRHHIIANSTFSWWAAWLNDNPRNITIAPSPWFKNASQWFRNYEMKGPVLKNWLTTIY